MKNVAEAEGILVAIYKHHSDSKDKQVKSYVQYRIYREYMIAGTYNRSI